MTRTALLAAALLALAGASHAARPLVTEDADVLDKGKCEAEGFYAHLKPSGFDASKGWTLQGSCGIGGNTQAILAYSRARSGGETAQGLLLGGKTAIIHHARRRRPRPHARLGADRGEGPGQFVRA